MVFSSLIFLYAFFSISLLACWLCREKKTQNAVLLVFSLIFYAWGEPKYVLLLLFMAFNAWACALGVQRAKQEGMRKFWVYLSSIIDIALIGWYKYAGLAFSVFGEVPEFVRNIALPIGISFYTFQLLTYVVDVYRREAPAQKSYWNVVLYASLFHQCIAGPIVRYRTVSRELFGRQPRKPQVAVGVSRFCAGLAKKVLLANPCGALADSLILADSAISDITKLAENLQALEGISVLGAWAGIIAYGLHIYLDFSAYSDMAIGMGKMLGLNYLENFNFPYISRSITEFWRRWHISLGTFFRDYVYIPLGGSRCSVPRAVLNTLVVWFLTGLWHGASWNFVLWGLWFFLFLMIERYLLRDFLDRVPVISNIYVLVVVALGWVIFRYTNVELGWALARSLFGANGNALTDFITETTVAGNGWLLLVSCLACTPFARRLKLRLERFAGSHGALEVVWNLVLYSLIPVALLLLCTAGLVGDSYNPFIYFQF